MRRLTLRALKKANIGNRVVVAHDGAEAVEYLLGTTADGSRNACAAAHSPRSEAAQARRARSLFAGIRGDERTRLLPVVILTTSVEDKDRLQGYSLGANSYVRKPVDFAEFAEAVVEMGLYWLVLNERPPAVSRHPGR